MRGTPSMFYAAQGFGMATGNTLYCSGAGRCEPATMQPAGPPYSQLVMTFGGGIKTATCYRLEYNSRWPLPERYTGATGALQ